MFSEHMEKATAACGLRVKDAATGMFVTPRASPNLLRYVC